MDEFVGKNKGKSGDGTTIYSYNENDVKKTDTTFPTLIYMEEIENHFDKCFPGAKTDIFHELLHLPGVPHIDTHFMQGSEIDDRIIVYTTGMSDFPMCLPDELKEDRLVYERAELMLYLPPTWPVNGEAFKQEANYWPIELLKSLARFPNRFNTWLGPGHTVPNIEGSRPYARSTRQNGALLLPLADELSIMKAADGATINIYCVIPLYKEEMDYKLKHGINALIDKFEQSGADMMTINPERSSTCRRSLFSFLST